MAFCSTPSRRSSPRKRRSGIALSTATTMSSICDNDDAAERQKRRKALTQLQTPVTTTTTGEKRRSFQPLRGLSASEISEHYSNCIKLSSENKINSKNAFGLHLIDYMQRMVRDANIDMSNFQVVSCTLDASTKIYAGRVDSVHSDAIKILSGIGAGSKQDSAKGDEADGSQEDEQGQTQKEKRTRKIKPSRTVETNWKNLNVANFDSEYSTDPMFRKWVGGLDEGGTDGLLFNALEARGQVLEYQLDSTCPVNQKELLEVSDGDIDVSDLRDYYHSIDSTTLEVCKCLSRFQFNNWDETSQGVGDIDIDLDRTHLSPPAQSEFTFVAPSTVDEEEDEANDIGFDDNGFDAHLPSESEPPDSTNEHTLLSRHLPPPGSASLPHLASVIQTTEYSYFDPTVLSTWAGPNHWKVKHMRAAAAMHESKEAKRSKTKKAPLRLDFTAEKDFEKEMGTSRAATVLSKATLTKQNADLTTLPVSVDYNGDALVKLFLKPDMAVQLKPSPPIQDKNEGDWYDYDNLNDSVSYCPALEMGGEDGNPDEGGDAAAVASQMPAASTSILFPGFSFVEPGIDQTFLLPGNLVAQPHRVERIHIDFAKRAKRVDVKKVKEKMWGLIGQHLSVGTPPADQAVETSPKKTAISFTDVHKDLLGNLGSSAREDLSFPVSVVCLLHLANEKGLYLSGVDSFDDISIAFP